MTTEQIREMLQSPAYEFLRSNEHLKGKIIFLTLGGSYSYGTNVETSDVDIRGCALNSRSDLLGLSNFEQVVHTGTDTTVYSFNKLVSLLLNCNPNTIEMLGCRPEQYMVCTDIGREMIENRKLFLSKRAVNSFGGYANQQLRRLENALARDKLPQARKEEHILNSIFCDEVILENGRENGFCKLLQEVTSFSISKAAEDTLRLDMNIAGVWQAT